MCLEARQHRSWMLLLARLLPNGGNSRRDFQGKRKMIRSPGEVTAG